MRDDMETKLFGTVSLNASIKLHPCLMRLKYAADFVTDE